MSDAFDRLRKAAGSSSDSLREHLNSLKNDKPKFEDKYKSLFWNLTKDDAGNGSAVIRFLPAPDGESAPFVRYWDYSFKGPTGLWYIANSLRTIDKPDPVGDYNAKQWATNDETIQNQVRKRKRQQHYVSNILVIKDPGNPENNGKVFYFKYGTQILNKIIEANTKSDELDDRVLFDPFNLWEGADFILRTKIAETGRPTYVGSTWTAPRKLFESDDALKNVWEQCRSLYTFIDPENADLYKPYDDLKARLHKVLCLDTPGLVQSTRHVPDTEDEPEPDADEMDDEDRKFFDMMKGTG